VQQTAVYLTTYCKINNTNKRRNKKTNTVTQIGLFLKVVLFKHVYANTLGKLTAAFTDIFISVTRVLFKRSFLVGILLPKQIPGMQKLFKLAIKIKLLQFDRILLNTEN
jgi:ABC-type microcin C transport system permease subunit YejB